MTDTKELFLEKLAAVHPLSAKTESFLAAPEYQGSGFRMRIKRLSHYRGGYLAHIAKRVKEHFVVRRDADAPAETFWGRVLMLPTLDANAQGIRQSGTLGGGENNLIRFLIKELHSDSVFYDIGANYGFYSALAEEFVLLGEIHAFEPSAKVFSYLKQISIGQNNVFLNNVAVSDSSGEIEFFDCAPDSTSGKSTIVKEVAAGSHRWHYETVRVPAATLDEYVRSHRSPTIIKIDVEGAEVRVLSGARAMLRRYSPTIAVELWSGEELSHFSLEVVVLLEELGYTPFFINLEGNLIETSTAHLKSWLAESHSEVNFIFKKI